MATVAELRVVIEAQDRASGQLRAVGQDVARLEQRVEGAGGAMARFRGAFGALGQLGLAGQGLSLIADTAGRAIGAVGDLVGEASDLNEQLSRSGVVFGSAADTVQDFARTTAQALGVSRTQALEAAGSFGTLFAASGVSQQAAADMSTSLVTLAADLASFNNLDPSDTLEKLRSGLVGEAEPLRAVGVLLNEAGVKAKAMELGLGGVGRELTEAEKVQARYALILEQTRTAQGDFARTSTGLANAQRVIRASFADIRAELGGALLPAVSRAAALFARELPRALQVLQGALTTLAPVLDAVFRGDLQEALNGALVLIGAVGARLAPQLAVWTQAFWAWVQEVTPRVLEGLSGMAGDVWAWIRAQAPTFLENLVGTWTPAFLTWVRDTVPPLLVELGRLLGEIGKWALTTAVPELQALGHDMGVALAEGLKTALVTEVPRVLREGVTVDVGGINVGVGLDPVGIARQVGQQVAAAVLASLTASAAATDPGASAALQGTGRTPSMPRATFAGVTFDFLLDGLQDTHEGMTTVREVPGGTTAYVDLGGPLLHRRTVTIRVDSEADYLTLAALPGTTAASGSLSSEAEGAAQDVVLLSIARTWRRGTGAQLCRTEWVYR